MPKHYAVLYDTPRGRAGFVMTFGGYGTAHSFFDDNPKKRRIGYVECADFNEAVTRAVMMERGEAGAFGPMPE